MLRLWEGCWEASGSMWAFHDAWCLFISFFTPFSPSMSALLFFQPFCALIFPLPPCQLSMAPPPHRGITQLGPAGQHRKRRCKRHSWLVTVRCYSGLPWEKRPVIRCPVGRAPNSYLCCIAIFVWFFLYLLWETDLCTYPRLV